MTRALQREDAERLQRCLEEGGVAVFPSDTVYGICCDPDSEEAARRLYALKGRSPRRACAIMFFSLEAALTDLHELTEAERIVLEGLLPGPLTLLLANRAHRYAPACREDPGTLGLRVPRLPEHLVALAHLRRGVMQSSANLSGEPDARTLADVPESMREGADLVLDGGELPGVASTVIDMRDFEVEGRWHLLREGALARETVQERLAALL
ncbi:MAG TPA: Sua5/YciO/YrdC/YwlC family protein [Solirubrobacteraceae bacterium]|nr:Sua5/YciO/YrdC/YwlC family protein [Solirubrobacteraceae bacterium]